MSVSLRVHMYAGTTQPGEQFTMAFNGMRPNRDVIEAISSYGYRHGDMNIFYAEDGRAVLRAFWAHQIPVAAQGELTDEFLYFLRDVEAVTIG
jgi:hypothetical protein